MGGQESGEQPFDDVCTQLRSVVERLDDLAYDALRRAVAAGERGRPQDERRITRARSAVERAIAILERDGTSTVGREGEAAEDDG